MLASIGHIFCRMPSTAIDLTFFSCLEWGSEFWRWTPDKKISICLITSKIDTINMIYPWENWPWSLGSFVSEICLFSIFYFNHLFLSVWTQGHLFYTLVITQYYFKKFLLKLFHFWPWEPSTWCLCAFNTLPSMGFLDHLFFWYYKILHDHLIYFYFSPKTVHVYKDAWVPVLFIATRVSLFTGLLSWQS